MSVERERYKHVLVWGMFSYPLAYGVILIALSLAPPAKEDSSSYLILLLTLPFFLGNFFAYLSSYFFNELKLLACASACFTTLAAGLWAYNLLLAVPEVTFFSILVCIIIQLFPSILLYRSLRPSDSFL